MVAGIIFVSVLGTLFHFAYEWSGNNSIIGLFTPVNESTWEHMKLIFFPMLIYTLYCCKRKKADCSGMLLGTLVGTLLIPVLFYTYSGALGFNLEFIDISIFYISVILAFCITYKASFSLKTEKYAGLLKLLILVMTLLFFIFTPFPPDIALFISPV